MFHAIFDIFSIQSVLIFIDSIDSGIFICKIINLLVKKVMDVKTQIKLKKQSFYCPSEFHSPQYTYFIRTDFHDIRFNVHCQSLRLLRIFSIDACRIPWAIRT